MLLPREIIDSYQCKYAPENMNIHLENRIAFVGDSLFSMGCGRLFEGTYEQMFASLNKLRALPDDTKVCF